MNIYTFVFLLFSLQFFYWMVGRRASVKLENQEDYFLAGKSVKLFPLMMTFLATQVGGGVVLGSAEEAYRYGWPVFLYPLGAALGLILLGSGIGGKLAQFQVSTVAQIFEVVYGSPQLKKIASLLSILSLFMILVAQIIASNKFLTSLGFSSTPLFILFWTVVIIYTAQGGLKAVIATDIVQALVFSMIFLGSFLFVGINEPLTFSLQAPVWEEFSVVSSRLCGWLLMPLLFMVIEQDMGQRCFAGSSSKIVSKASFLAGMMTMLICIVPVFLGVLAKQMGLEINPNGSVLMAVIEKSTPPLVSALVGCAVLAAILSTATSLMNAISSNLAGDFGFAFLKNTEPLRLAKISTCILSLAALFFAFNFDNIVDLLIQSYELSVSCLFVPVMAALFKRTGNYISALNAVLLGAISFVLFRFYPIGFQREIVALMLSLLGFILGEVWVLYQKRVSVYES